MEQWVGILLGFIVAIAIIIAYMYRRSNFENATSAPPQDALVVTGVVETPGAPVQPSPPPTAQPPTMMPTQPPTMMPTQPPTTMPTQPPTTMPTQPPTMMPTQAETSTMMPQTTAPTMMPTQPPTMMPTQSEMDIEPAYDAKFAEYTPEDDIKVM